MSDLRHTGMMRLADAHSAVLEAIPATAPVVYLDYPVALNVGDLLIMMGTLELLRKGGRQIRLARNLHDTESEERLPIGNNDTILLQGGGNFGDLYPHIQAYRERIVSQYPDHKIVVLPQTVYFRDAAALRRSAALFSKHPKLKFFVRDRKSLRIVQDNFSVDVSLVPDLAHQLWPSLLSQVAAGNGEQERELYFLRRDEEVTAQSLAWLPAGAKSMDWSDVVNLRLRVIKQCMLWMSTHGGSKSLSTSFSQAYFRAVTRQVQVILRRLYRHDVWITSRLHGAIGGMLLGKPVFVLDNNYGKLSDYIETWRDALHPIVLIRTEEEAKRAIEIAMRRPPRFTETVLQYEEFSRAQA